MTPPTTISRWVLLAQTGDGAAFDALLRDAQAGLHRLVSRLVGDSHEAEDVLQETFLAIHAKLRWLRDPALFRPWAWRIAARAATRRLTSASRARARAHVDAEIDLLPAPEALPSSVDEYRDRLPVLLDELSPASRVVIVLHFLEEMALDDVAETLDLPLGTVKSRLGYGLASLRKAAADIRRKD